MALYTNRDIHELTGIAQSNLYNYRKRGQLIWDPKTKLYNSEEPINKDFLLKFANSDKITTEPKRQQKKQPPNGNKKDNSISVQEKKLQAELDLKELDREKKVIELEKLKGSLVDLEETIGLVREYSLQLKREILQNIKTLLQDIGARHNIEPDKVGDYKLTVDKIMKEANDKSINNLKSKL